MKIAILGGGITGLTAAYCLSKKGHKVTLIEKEKVLGGLAVGFKADGWTWNLERAYHHLFANDYDIINFATDIGFDKIFFESPETSSLYEDKNGYRILPMDTPIDLLRFPYLGLIDKIRTGIVLAFLKISPFLKLYEKVTSEDFLKITMGNTAWNKLWQQLFRGKFGDYAGIILASFIWARINKRTKKLGYIKGGFQEFIDYLVKKLKDEKVTILAGHEIKDIRKRGKGFTVNGKAYGKVVSTLPTSIMARLTQNIFQERYLGKFSRLKYLHAVTLIIETDLPILKDAYWLNICSGKMPLMLLAQHTNFMDKKHYGGRHIAYTGWYVKGDSKMLKMDKKEVLKLVLPYARKISKNKFKVVGVHLFKGPFAQPIFDAEFAKNRPGFKTPVKNFYIANLDMTYPYDRGTNYAVKLGREVSEMIR
jgi:protoporphyrinogen oxidase